jgi:glyoxylase-like metal-dependent hydrolase (beta-lactamase superfamily II)
MPIPASALDVGTGVTRFVDTCNVYVLRAGGDAVLVDFGSGAVLDHLDDLGVGRVTDVLVTHHHRDQVQGLQRAVDAGARVWVPPVERDLFAGADEHWRARRVVDDYDLREDRFSLLEAVEVAGTVDEYRTRRYGGIDVYALPTPGHTIGSVTYLVEIDGRRLAFCGDLVYGDGRLWSLAATQWTYSGVTGQAATVLSCGILAGREPDVLLPSHGDPVEDPPAALARVREKLTELLELRRVEDRPWDLEGWLRDPWEVLSPHLLRNRTSIATSYAVLSETGAALIVDWGYDLWTGIELGNERAANRPMLASIERLEGNHGVRRVDAAVATHFHDDHIAGMNLLRDVHGAEVWAPANVAPVLEEPERYDLPCLWYDPVPVDRVLAFDEPIAWHEYEVAVFPLPGHTLYAAAILVEVDGRRVLFTGDQQSNDDGRSTLNYQYRNRFRPHDYVRSAELYASLRPDLILGGHWAPLEVTEERLQQLLEDGRRLEELHAELLPEGGPGARGFVARIDPYRATVEPGGELEAAVVVENPLDRDTTAIVRLVVPDGWRVEPPEREVEVSAEGEATARFHVRTGAEPVRRARVAADVTIGETRFGQQAEALVDVE